MSGKTLSAKITNDELAEEWEDWVEEEGFNSKSEALRAAMREVSMNDDHTSDIQRGFTAGLCGLISITLGQVWLLHGLEFAGILFLLTLIVVSAAYSIPYKEVNLP